MGDQIRHSPERGLLIRVYRLVLPHRLRAGVAARLSGETRNRLVTFAAEARNRPIEALSRARLRLWMLLVHPGVRHSAFGHITTVQGKARLGSRPRAVAPAAAAQANLDLVCDLLERAGIEYFRVRPRAYTRNAVAVPLGRRPAVIKALRAGLRDRPGYVLPVDRRGEVAGAQRSTLGRGAWRRAADRPVLRFWHYHVVADRLHAYGAEYACDIEFWEERGGGARLRAAQPNLVAGVVSADYEPVHLPNGAFTAFEPMRQASDPTAVTTASGGAAESRTYPTHPYFGAPVIDDVTFPIDFVYTWVNGDDPGWQARRDAALAGVDPLVRLSDQAVNDARFMSRDELRYSLRSVAAHAPWVRRIYLVTDQQIPSWLSLGDDRLVVVDHREIFQDAGVLPVFNSHAIESQLHHIDGLSEHFVYFNDDVFLGRPVPPSFFFHSNGVARFFPSKALLPMGPRLPDDTPVAASGKNNRALIEAMTGKRIAAKMRHVPHALRRSVLAEIEERYRDQVTMTATHRFRHPEDLAIVSSLAHYYGYATGRAVPADLEYDYVDLAQPSSPRRLNRFLAERRFDVFCLNDTTSERAMFQRQSAMLDWFLRGYYPVPSPFEAPAVGEAAPTETPRLANRVPVQAA